jgi:hypothetical protein
MPSIRSAEEIVKCRGAGPGLCRTSGVLPATSGDAGRAVLGWRPHGPGRGTGPGLYKNLGYKPLDDFEYLGMVVDVPMTLIGWPTLKEDTFDQFKAHC